MNSRSSYQSYKLKNQMMGDEHVKKSVGILRSAVDKIYKQQASTLSFEELYRNAYTLVINKHGKMLYKEITESIKRNILPYVSELKEVSADQEEAFLGRFNEIWGNHVLSLGMVSDISMYLDKNYVVKEKLKSIHDSGVLLFKKHVYKNPAINQTFQDLVFRQIQNERSGEQAHQDVLRTSFKILIDLGLRSNSVYQSFEKVLLEKTGEYYVMEANRLIGESTCAEYLKGVQRRMREEEERCLSYMVESTKTPLMDTIVSVMVEAHACTLINMESGLRSMVNNYPGSTQAIGLMYDLFSKNKNALASMETFLVKEVKETGEKHLRTQCQIKKAQEAAQFVDYIVDMKFKFNKIMEVTCKKDNELTLSVKKAFEEFLNKKGTEREGISGLLAKHIDHQMKNDIRGLTDE